MTTQTTRSTTPIFCWNELLTSDTAAATAFYTDLLGWTAQAKPCGDFDYTVFTCGSTQVAGMMEIHWEGCAGHWVGYVQVDDVAAAATSASGLGATINCPPTDVSGCGRFATICDPAGAAIGIYKSLGDSSASST